MYNFPDSPTPGQTYQSWVWDGVTWLRSANQNFRTAKAKNIVVNPSMWVTQEWASGQLFTATNLYVTDQWMTSFLTSGAVSFQQVATPAASKSASPYRIRMVVTTADTSLSAGEYCQLLQPIEGARCVELQWGQADAQQAVLRFGFKGPAGTYSVRIGNAASDRSYVAQFTISAAQANTETDQVIVIPGDITGTWLSTSAVGLFLQFIFASGSTFTGVLGWQAGNMMAATGQSNGLGVVNNTFEIWDVGLHVDPDKTGIAPPYEVQDYDDALFDSLRYYQITRCAFGTGTAIRASMARPAMMRAAPSMTLSAGSVIEANVSNFIVDVPNNNGITATSNARM